MVERRRETPHVHRSPRVAVVAALLLTLFGLAVAAGCGGDGDGAAETTEAETTETVTTDTGTETETDPDADEEQRATGRDIFVASCAGCHTLADADATGSVGPSLDGRPLVSDAVEQQVREGGGGMPAFEGQLTDDEIEAVAAYVATVAGGP